MWLPDRRTFLTLAALSGCGFAPAYGPGGVAAGLQGTIRAADPNDKNGFDLVQRLEQRLGRPQSPRYDLGYSIATEEIGVGVTPDGSITRYTLTGQIDWGLRDAAGALVASGRVDSFTAYSATGSTVAGLAAAEDAARRLMHILADQIVMRLTATAADWRA